MAQQPAEVSLPRVRDAIDRALAIDLNLSEMIFDPEAKKASDTPAKLNPLAEAIAACQRAVENPDGSLENHATMAVTCASAPRRSLR